MSYYPGSPVLAQFVSLDLPVAADEVGECLGEHDDLAAHVLDVPAVGLGRLRVVGRAPHPVHLGAQVGVLGAGAVHLAGRAGRAGV